MEIPHADSADLYKQLREDDESRRIFKHNERQTPIAAAAENLPRPPANVPSTRNDWNPGWEFTDEIFDIMQIRMLSLSGSIPVISYLQYYEIPVCAYQ